MNKHKLGTVCVVDENYNFKVSLCLRDISKNSKPYLLHLHSNLYE